MRNTIFASALLSAAAFLATPASAAVTLCSTGPVIDLVNDGCTAPGNDHLADVEAALAAATGVDVNTLNLFLYGKSDENQALFSFPADGDPHNGTSTDWVVLDGTLIKYITVKASNDFKLYELAGLGASSGLNLNTLGIGKGKHDISHISFWTVPGSPVPEPATWAMMILGMGAVGAAMRARKTSTKVSFA